MPGISVSIDASLILGRSQQMQRAVEGWIERAALTATRRAAELAKTNLRGEMSGAGLGRLGQAIGSTSDAQKGRGVFRRPGGGFSASGIVFIRTRSERTRGAIEAYTEGADIRPVRSRWLWIPSDQIPRLGAGRYRLTPGTWRSSGMEAKIGPLVRVRASNGNPLLIVRNVGVALSGKSRSARALTKRGLPRKGQAAQEFIVAFIGIPRTARSARIDVTAVMRSVQAELPSLFNQAFGQNAGRG